MVDVEKFDPGITPSTKHPFSNSLSVHPEGESVYNVQTTSEMLACLRRASRSEALLDPSLEGGNRQKNLASYLARVVAIG